jgi:hypothetical protein
VEEKHIKPVFLKTYNNNNNMMMMKETSVPTEQEAGRTPESDWTVFRKEQSLVS